jgi:hypothetical protein
MDAKTFWRFRDQKREALLQQHQQRLTRYRASQDITDLEGQPADGKSLYIVSREVPGIVEAGAVTEATYGLAAQRILESSHDVATAEQIARFLRQQAENLALSRELDARTRERQMVTIPATAPAPLRPAGK